MANTKFRKGYVFLLVILVALSGVVYAGSTLATDDLTIKEVLPGVNLNVYDQAERTYKSMTGNTGVSAFSEDILWCPGATHIAYIQVENEKEVNVEFSLVLDLKIQDDFEGFNDYFSYAVLPLDSPDSMKHTNWTDFRNDKDVVRKGTLVNSTPSGLETLLGTTHQNILVPRTELSSGFAVLYAVAIHMEENTPNKYQDATMNMTFVLGAEQDITEDGLNFESTSAPSID